MADKNLLSQMLESLVNDEQAKAEELFHEYVVAKSREIYEGLIESEMDEEEVDEATEEEEEEESVEEGMEVTFTETDDEEDTVDFGGDATDDLAGEFGGEEGEGEFGDDMGEEPAEAGEEELFQDLEDIVDQLQAKFDELKGIETDEHGADFGAEGEDEAEAGEGEEEEEEETEEGFDLETVREYVEKVGVDWDKNGLRKEGEYSGTGTQSDSVNLNTKSIVAGKNDMGGTAKNIAQAGTEKSPVEANKGQLKGNGLLKGNVVANPDASGNVNVPGGNAGKTGFKKKEPGHGAEKKGEGEGKYSGTGSHSDSVNVTKTSLFRGRR